MPIPIIETASLTKRYRDFVAVNEIALRVAPRQVFGFLGPNGSGKTTTIGMLLGTITPSSGSLTLFDGGTPRDLHRARQRIGATLESPSFYPHLTARDNLNIMATIKGLGLRAVDEALENVGLTGRKRDLFRTYSYGMKQRLAVACALLGDPDLIIMDEPTNGLDPEGIYQMREIVLSLADRGKTVFISSHLLSEVERTCTHAAIIARGRILQQGAVSSLAGGPTRVELSSDDMVRLETAVRRHPAVASAVVLGGLIIAELRGDNPTTLSRSLTDDGIVLSHLAVRQRTLEEAYLAMTGAGRAGGT